MSYYPKSQTTNNLYSNGDFIVIRIQQAYYGYYYKTSDGSYYSGQTPNTTPSFQLVPKTNNNSGIINKIPQYLAVQPTQQDYSIGEFTRYFCKKTNEIIYIEISKDSYNQLVTKNPNIYWQLYMPFTLSWQLKGKSEESVYNINQEITKITSFRLKLTNFTNYLNNDFLKYYLAS